MKNLATEQLLDMLQENGAERCAIVEELYNRYHFLVEQIVEHAFLEENNVVDSEDYLAVAELALVQSINFYSQSKGDFVEFAIKLIKIALKKEKEKFALPKGVREEVSLNAAQIDKYNPEEWIKIIETVSAAEQFLFI